MHRQHERKEDEAREELPCNSGHNRVLFVMGYLRKKWENERKLQGITRDPLGSYWDARASLKVTERMQRGGVPDRALIDSKGCTLRELQLCTARGTACGVSAGEQRILIMETGRGWYGS